LERKKKPNSHGSIWFKAQLQTDPHLVVDLVRLLWRPRSSHVSCIAWRTAPWEIRLGTFKAQACSVTISVKKNTHIEVLMIIWMHCDICVYYIYTHDMIIILYI
jgi:hypothetical protein